jgi:restriction system protein
LFLPAASQGKRVANGAAHIELVDLDRFLELWLQHYSKIPELKRSKLRLEPIHFLAVVSLT